MKPIDLIQTGTVVFAVCGSAFVDIVLTICSVKTCRTNTLVIVNSIIAVGLVFARVTRAVIDILFAVVALVTCWTNALIAVYFISASSSILAWK